MNTSIICETNNSCSRSQIFCGYLNYTENDIDSISLTQCIIKFAPNTITISTEIHCNGIKNCIVNADNNNHQFISSTLHCYNNNECQLYCPYTKSCTNSKLICYSSSNCQCIGNGCNHINIFQLQYQYITTTTTTTTTSTSSTWTTSTTTKNTYYGLTVYQIVLINSYFSVLILNNL